MKHYVQYTVYMCCVNTVLLSFLFCPFASIETLQTEQTTSFSFFVHSAIVDDN